MPKRLLSRTLGKDDLFIVPTLDGSNTLYSRDFASTYHSVNGAVSESRHVFIQHGLRTQLHLPEIHVLEIGFGTGLNAFLAFLLSEKHKKPVHYTGLESFPIDTGLIFHLDYPSYLVAEKKTAIFLKCMKRILSPNPAFNLRSMFHGKR